MHVLIESLLGLIREPVSGPLEMVTMQTSTWLGWCWEKKLLIIKQHLADVIHCPKIEPLASLLIRVHIKGYVVIACVSKAGNQ